MATSFDSSELKKLFQSKHDSVGEDNGLVTIIGGSKLFHGAPLLSLKVASKIVDMVFLASPEPGVGGVAERIKSKLFSFVWVPWDEVEKYVEKSDAVLIGPGLMRYAKETLSSKLPGLAKRSQVPSGTWRSGAGKIQNGYDEVGRETRDITKRLLIKFPNKRWVIDAGSLQVMDVDWIPKNAILTPNKKEYELLFGNEKISETAKKFKCIIISKGPTSTVCSPDKCVEIQGGNPGLTKGGTGDVLAGLAVSLLAKNDPFLAATATSYITKAAADELHKVVGTNFSADDLADKIPQVLHKAIS